MLGRTHISGGIVTSLLFCGDDMSAIVFVVIGSILPDIDHPGSMIGKNIPLLPRLFKHRGFTHSILFCLLMSLVNMWICIGCFVHIIMDMMTKQGVELFYPLKSRIRFPLARYVVTNGIFEKMLLYVCYIIIFYLLYIRYC